MNGCLQRMTEKNGSVKFESIVSLELKRRKKHVFKTKLGDDITTRIGIVACCLGHLMGHFGG